MTYWHMQLHPNDISWGREKQVLEETALIGLGDWDSTQVTQFEKEMKIGDIVLIKRGAEAIALVEVASDSENDEDAIDWDLDWFSYRRQVKILAFADGKKPKFPLPRGTLKKSVSIYTDTYKYIDDWYSSIAVVKIGVKLRKLHISKAKSLKDFKINFLNPDNSTKQVIVLAGINGSGKTTIFEYLNNFITSASFDGDDFVQVDINGDTVDFFKDINKGKSKGISSLKKNLYYFPVFDDSLEKMSNTIVRHIDKIIYEEHMMPDLAYEKISSDFKEIFADFDLQIQFDSLNRDKQVLFKNKSGDIFSIKELSTGEKVLLSRIFYLYISEIHDSVILIDEPEMSLHPKWQRLIFNVYNNFAEKNNNQIIMATHSPQIIATTPYQNLIKLEKQKERIVPYYFDSPPIGADINSILDDFMDVPEKYPKVVSDLHDKYREKVRAGLDDTKDSEDIRLELLKYESNDSRFMQEMRIIRKLRGKK